MLTDKSGFPDGTRCRGCACRGKRHKTGRLDPSAPSLGGEDPLKAEMATHSRIPAWKILRTRGAWQATVPGVSDSDMTDHSTDKYKN